MRMRRASIIAGLIAGGLALTAAIGVSAAQASSVPADDASLVTPSVQRGTASYFTDAQIDDVWAAVTKNYPSPLPEGYKFSAKAPVFFHPTDGKEHLFQSGLPDEIAARFWRCAWLDTSISATAANRTSAATIASSRLSGYANLPGVAQLVDTKTYEDQMAAYGKTIGEDSNTAEFGLECAGFDTDGITK